MGYMRHHVIVITANDEKLIQKARNEAKKIFQPTEIDNFKALVSSSVEGCVNDYYTFCVGPDGSKDGWGPSDDGDRYRNELIDWLEEQRYGDNSSPYDWVEIQYGDDERETKIIRHSDEKEIADE